jgi:CRP-like cAMP-binding protein
MEEVLQFLGSIRPLTQACIDDLQRFVDFKKFPKGQKILDIGEVNDRLLLIKTGVLYCYSYVGDDSVPHWFFWDLATVVSIGAFYERKLSSQCIVPLVDTEAYFITREQYEYLCETHLEFANIARVLLQKYLIIFASHAENFRKHTAEERYQWVLDNMPELLQRVPQNLVAPWLNMDQATLSRVRGNRP